MTSKLKYDCKLKSAALQFTIFIAVLIALLLTGFILYAYTFNYFKEQSKATIDIVQLSNSGINYLINTQRLDNDTIELTSLENENRKVKVQLSEWGVFDKAIAIAQHRKKTVKKLAIIGGLYNSDTSPTLYLQETYNPLSLVGNTQLKGNIFLPSQGVKSGYIAGQSYYGSQLVYGKKENSGVKLPEISSKIFQELEKYTDNNNFSNEDTTFLGNTKKQLNSFKSKTKLIYSTKEIFLSQVEMVGNIIIKSNKKIIISKLANLKDVILIAPEVEIENNSKGTFQVIATKRIIVGSFCKLSYPSALVVWDNSKSAIDQGFENKIKIGTESQVNGCVCYFNKNNNESDFKAKIILEEKAIIKGQVYCQGGFELKGNVSGSVYVKQFIANQVGSVFVNHIYNGIIENENIPEKCGGLLFENNPKTIMKWLY